MFEEWEAARGANLDLWKWRNNEYPNEFKAEILAWWEGHVLVETHRTDANIPPKRKGKG